MPGNILIVEDESAIADTIQYALETESFTAAWVTSGSEAEALLRQEHFELVILDVGLPDISGFELLRRLRAFTNVPVIFLTARSDEIDRVVALEIGADDYVTKPFSFMELRARVDAVLRRDSPARGLRNGGTLLRYLAGTPPERLVARYRGGD